MNENINKAIDILNQGGIVIFPTDTAFGIGCRIDRIDSIERLFEIRKRPVTQATPILINSLEMAKNYVHEIPKDVEEKLINKYWPGALTIVLKAEIEKIPSLVRGEGENIGLRIPNNEFTLEIINKINVPLLGPSANFHGESTPYEYKDLDNDLIKLVDFVLDGECQIKNASTVIDCTKKPWEILRNGAIEINI